MSSAPAGSAADRQRRSWQRRRQAAPLLAAPPIGSAADRHAQRRMPNDRASCCGDDDFAAAAVARWRCGSSAWSAELARLGTPPLALPQERYNHVHRHHGRHHHQQQQHCGCLHSYHHDCHHHPSQLSAAYNSKHSRKGCDSDMAAKGAIATQQPQSPRFVRQ
eukprot:355819-Chlamydomonas_euryale.AAC.1